MTARIRGMEAPTVDGDWRDRAACRDEDPELFFVATEHQPYPLAARVVCAACTVRAECLEWALATGQRWGMWGGTTEAERREMRKRARQERGAR